MEPGMLLNKTSFHQALLRELHWLPSPIKGAGFNLTCDHRIKASGSYLLRVRDWWEPEKKPFLWCLFPHPPALEFPP